MSSLNSVILYVDNIDVSTRFYKAILAAEPIETFQDFALFALNESFMLGLQSKHAIEPVPQPAFGGFELCLSDVSIEEVDATYQLWKKNKVAMALEPTHLDFGYTFVALDPDGHRLRICATDTTNVS